ncbi:MAG: hypothetical protein EOO70_06690 [Myxococcaceae bacterium]|nr:MAG: hypothetical protein EOO70_06690 [Myxococcaceae bacterium]
MGLYKTVAKEFGIQQELHGIARALSNTIQNIGAQRTKAGDAHGRAPNQQNADIDEAEFVVTAAGVVSTFLMRRLRGHAAQRAAPAQSTQRTGDNGQ